MRIALAAIVLVWSMGPAFAQEAPSPRELDGLKAYGVMAGITATNAAKCGLQYEGLKAALSTRLARYRLDQAAHAEVVEMTDVDRSVRIFDDGFRFKPTDLVCRNTASDMDRLIRVLLTSP